MLLEPLTEKKHIALLYGCIPKFTVFHQGINVYFKDKKIYVFNKSQAFRVVGNEPKWLLELKKNILQ